MKFIKQINYYLKTFLNGEWILFGPKYPDEEVNRAVGEF